MAKPDTTPALGTLVAWGGGGDDELLDWLAGRYAGQAGTVEVIPTATPRQPLVSGRAYANSFRRRGFSHVDVLHFTRTRPADSRTSLRRLEAAGLLFFCGGDQELLTAALAGTRFLEILLARFRAGEVVVVGTSAGAAALPDQMIVGGWGYRSLLAGRVRTAPGLGLLPGVFLDQHFTERGRFARLAHAVLREPQRLGLGLGEETGVVIENGHATVLGEAVVSVVDGRDSHAPDLLALPHGQPISGHNLHLHLLTAGMRVALNGDKG